MLRMANGGGHMARSWGHLLGAKSSQVHEPARARDLKHIASRSWALPTPEWAGATFFLGTSRGEWRLADTLTPVLWNPEQRTHLDSDLQKLWDKECLFKATVGGPGLHGNIKQMHLNWREPKLRESKKLAKVRAPMSGRAGIQTKIYPQIGIFNPYCFPAHKNE